MDKVLNLASQIGDLFTSSENYKKYMNLYDEIKADKELLEKLTKYRNLKMQNYVKHTVYDEVNNDYDSQIAAMYKELNQVEIVNEMFSYEDELLKILSEVYKIIGEKCVMNIDS